MATDDSSFISIIYFIGLSMLAHFISRRSIPEAGSWNGIKRSLSSWPRVCVLVIFLDSWAFLFASGFLTLAIGLEENTRVCAAAIYMCICFYTTSKFFIYAFLIEKVHIVWSNPGTPRFQSRTFVVCFIALIAYLLIMVLLFFGRIHFISEVDMCTIGLQHWSAVPLLTYDLVINIVLTGMFIWPLKGNNKLNPKLKRVATRTLVAAAFALTSSTGNIAVLAALRGKEPGWVCLACCTADVLVNASAIYWATGLNSEGQRYTVTSFPEDEFTQPFPTLTMTKSQPHFTVTTTHSQHVLSPISVSNSRSAIGKVVYPRTPPRLSGNEPYNVITVQSHSFQSGPMIFSNGTRVSYENEYPNVHAQDIEDDLSSLHAPSLTCEDDIIDAAFAGDVHCIPQTLPREEVLRTRT